MGLIFIRTTLIFIALLVVMRLMGKRQIGEMQPFEFIITLVIAELACIPMADSSIPLLYGIVSILTIFLLHQIMCILDLAFKPMKFMFSGKPSIVITKDGIDVKELKKNSLDVSDLIESLRSKGYFSLDDVDYALYEANGNFSTLESPNRDSENTSVPMIIIDEGKFDQNNVKLCNKSTEFFKDILKKQKIKKLKDVIILTFDGNGKIYLQEKNKKFISLKLENEENKW